ncbi:putative E3 ubiquitin-protein ligase UBR7 [Thalassophryne amazonica]|uniref:putative E3 ubiquitin-protein ligase UBR7 n=1 Tax=Thalassophryne amazonica TaxID=390379 RepID=UPI001471AF24|nr:putative E3 ubiquitin-protein ligase UBR7 [Thalassophryne amazonica]
MAVTQDECAASFDEDELREALCVLAGSDPDNCSYSRGYVKRQAVFACSTCTPSAAEPAGICLACANKCHDGHDIFELYTKRNFRCDCGNAKFVSFQCQLIPMKDEENVKNCYNHNFRGTYCSCDRPYPDTEDQTNDEMIQCVICEDWFHSRHLGCMVVDSEELQEMVCETCMNKAPYLWTYAAHFAVKCPEEEVDINVEEEGQCGSGHKDSEEESSTSQGEKQEHESRSSGKRTHGEMTGDPVKASVESCRLQELQAKGPERPRVGAVFWPYSWRSKLCTCISCKRAYVEAGVQFLMDQSDTVLAYENQGMEEPFGEDPLMSLLSSMDHVQQLEIIYQLNDMKTELYAFLNQFAVERKVVTAEAIYQFFEGLQSRKRRRITAGYQ